MKKIYILATVLAFCFTSEGMRKFNVKNFDDLRTIHAMIKNKSDSFVHIPTKSQNKITESHIMSELSLQYHLVEAVDGKKRLAGLSERVTEFRTLILNENPLGFGEDTFFIETLNDIAKNMRSVHKNVKRGSNFQKERSNILRQLGSLLEYLSSDYFVRPFMLTPIECDQLEILIPCMPRDIGATIKIISTEIIDPTLVHWMLSTVLADLIFITFRDYPKKSFHSNISFVRKGLEKAANFILPRGCIFGMSLEKTNTPGVAITTEISFMLKKKGRCRSKKSIIELVKHFTTTFTHECTAHPFGWLVLDSSSEYDYESE
ncbi:MAG: hypothetical protein LBB21_00050 [Holosporaceae bacterium]|jgi:hypothetical protein|nr:hypothetical protein [Holosporaceae bacterium]